MLPLISNISKTVGCKYNNFQEGVKLGVKSRGQVRERAQVKMTRAQVEHADCQRNNGLYGEISHKSMKKKGTSQEIM